jgi:Tol biopolymer transport system component
LNDSETIIYRAWERKSEGQRGMPMTIFTIKDDGTDLKQITHDDGTNWAPHPAPDGDHFAFIRVLPPMNFEIFIMSIKTGEQIRMTYNDAFDGFPVISEDGNTLAFSSNRDEPKGVRNLSPYFMDISSLNLGKK